MRLREVNVRKITQVRKLRKQRQRDITQELSAYYRSNEIATSAESVVARLKNLTKQGVLN